MSDATNMRQFEGAVVAGKYRLDKYLDEGGFGAVFKATQTAYGQDLREVAVKLAKRPMEDAEARRAFADALLMVKVVEAATDPAVKQKFVAVFDAGRCPDGGPLAAHPYIVMEYVRGGSLEKCLRYGPFPLARAMDYFGQMLSAVAVMHGGGEAGSLLRRPVAHRDIKPDNVLVVRRDDGPDVVKVTDFGLAVEVDTLLGWVESGGDMAYMAPESFSHDICSPQSDVYMLGLVFYAMLSGGGAFREVGCHLRGTEEEKRAECRRLHLRARRMERFSLLGSHDELSARPALADVVRTALQTDMTARTYRNAVELKAAWEQALGQSPAAARDRPKVAERPWEEARRLASEAEQCFAAKDFSQGDALLCRAVRLNDDRRLVPDPMVSGYVCMVAVRRLIEQGEAERAGQVAWAGHQRRECRSTCRAMAMYYAKSGSPLAAEFRRKADLCADKE